MLSALQQNGLENILETASKTVDVIFVAKMCPQLEAQLSLLQPRPIAKRRHSTLLTGQRQKIKNRRHTCAGNFPNLFFVHNIYLYPWLIFHCCRRLSILAKLYVSVFFGLFLLIINKFSFLDQSSQEVHTRDQTTLSAHGNYQ